MMQQLGNSGRGKPAPYLVQGETAQAWAALPQPGDHAALLSRGVRRNIGHMLAFAVILYHLRHTHGTSPALHAQ